MCECLEYPDGSLFLCPVCADMARETERTLAVAMGMLRIIHPNLLNAGGSVEFAADVAKLINEGHTDDVQVRRYGAAPAAPETAQTSTEETGRAPGWETIDPPF